MLGKTQATVVLAGLEHNGVPGVLNAARLVAVAIPFGPIGGLMVVPETTYVNVPVA